YTRLLSTSFCQCSPHHRDLTSFPTRRSSDLGCFKKKDNAKKLIANLSKKGIDSFTAPTTISGETWYRVQAGAFTKRKNAGFKDRSEEHTSELQSRFDLVCRLLLEKKK